ncbi:MAG: putative S-layer associated protein [Symbiobacteriaceae bacterium]|jgi:hypothetical protein|nr:putative S-layer associated protein [Symbiobacteriaceae bacterium]
MRRIISIFTAAVLLAAAWPMPTVAAAARLSDMQTHWARTQVEAGVAAGYVSGYPDGSFKPDASITRAEFYKLLGAAMRLSAEQTATGFAEERQGPLHWSFTQGHIPAAVASGLLVPSDYADVLSPDTRVTRREIVLAAVRALGKEPLVAGSRQVLENPDWAGYPAWLKPYAAIAVGSGIVTGYADRTLGLERNATRAEALVMVQRILGQVTVGLTAEAGSGDANAIRHPGEGEPTWTWREAAPGRPVISNGTLDQDYPFGEAVSGLVLMPAPVKAAWVRYMSGTTGVVARLSRGKLTEVARYPGATPEPLTVDDDGWLWFTDGASRLLVASPVGEVLPVESISDRLTTGAIDWNGHFWGIGSSGTIWRVTSDLAAISYPLEMRPDQVADFSAIADDGSLWLLLKGASAEGGAKVEAVKLAYGKVTKRVSLLGPYFGGVAGHARVRVVGRSGPFLWTEARVIGPDFAERNGGLYRLNLETGEFTRVVLPRDVAAAMEPVSAADGGAVLRDTGGRFWRMLP